MTDRIRTPAPRLGPAAARDGRASRLVLLGFAAAFLLAAGCGKDSGQGPPVETGPTPVTIRETPFPEMSMPEDNPLTKEGIRLGRLLFYDPILSGDSTQSCASCHVQSAAFADPRRLSIGIDGFEGTVNAPSLVNTGWNKFFFWNGRAPSLEDQALQPVPNPIEMHLPWDDGEIRLNAHPYYPQLFEKAFGTKVITRDLIVKAIAQFERTMISDRSRYDAWVRDPDANPLTEQEKRGYGKYLEESIGDCFHCHGISGLFNMRTVFENNGLDAEPDSGLAAITKNPYHMGLFRAPTLRNIELTAPYMHDGRFNTLEEVLEHYSTGLHDHPTLNTLLRQRLLTGTAAAMTAEDKQDIIAFLKTLTDRSFTTDPAFSNPFENGDPFQDP
jgi:cytochrome c peroxidase